MMPMGDFTGQQQQQQQSSLENGFEARLATQTGLQYIQIFYEAVDNNREGISDFYQPWSSIIWNGRMLSGLDQIRQAYAELPRSQHTLQSIDAQPSTINMGDKEMTCILVTASGIVEYGSDATTKRLFSQSFLVVGVPRGDRIAPYIVNDMFRWITPVMLERAATQSKAYGKTLVKDKKRRFYGKDGQRRGGRSSPAAGGSSRGGYGGGGGG